MPKDSTETPPNWVMEPDPDQDIVLDASSVKVMAHPVRIRMLGILRTQGPQTSTSLAHLLGVSSGLTSYHLRQLAQYGLVAEDEERGTGRERWWRAPHRATYHSSAALGEEGRDDSTAYLRALSLVYLENIQRGIDHHHLTPAEWHRTSTLSDFPLLLTPDEARSLLAELFDVVARYRTATEEHPDAPPGAEPFMLQMQAFPTQHHGTG